MNPYESPLTSKNRDRGPKAPIPWVLIVLVAMAAIFVLTIGNDVMDWYKRPRLPAGKVIE